MYIIYYVVIVITVCPLRHALEMTNFSVRLDICRHRRRADEPPLIPPRATCVIVVGITESSSVEGWVEEEVRQRLFVDYRISAHARIFHALKL